MLKHCISLGCVLAGVGLVAAPVDAQEAAYVAATWGDNAVHLLDIDLNNLRSFPTGARNPNGIATNGETIWSGHFATREVIAWDLNGKEQYRWSGDIPYLLGMELVEDEILIAHRLTIRFHDARNGEFKRTIPSRPGVEGLAWDGQCLWQLQTQIIYCTDINNGNDIRQIQNAAAGCAFGGTGITASARGELTLACNDGQWFKVRSSDGGVIDSGNNGQVMYGLKVLGARTTCVQKIRKSKPKRGCESCPPKGGPFEIENSCEKPKDCPKRVKTTILCPEGPGKCKIKAARDKCE